MTNPLLELQRLGQSPWHDNIRRRLLTSGTLKRMVEDGDITGLTSNPTIFDQAIAGGHEYDAQLRTLARQGKTPDEIFDALAITDIRNAADVFAPVYARTGGGDGFVSIEVAPRSPTRSSRTCASGRRSPSRATASSRTPARACSGRSGRVRRRRTPRIPTSTTSRH